MIAFVVNPVAQKGRSAAIWQNIESHLRYDGHEFSVMYTECPGDGRNKALRAASQGATRIISVGGDGTVQEVVNSTYGMGLEIGVVPVGTGNDFARTAGIPKEPLAAAVLALEGEARPVDLGKVDGRLFTNVAGLGFDADVAERANRSKMLVSGSITYFLSVLATLYKFQCREVTIDIDGLRWTQRILFVAVGNGKYLGGGMKIVPSAVLDDGLFDIVVAGDLTKAETLLTLPKVYTGEHVKHPKATQFRGKRVSVESHETLPVHADGEVIATTPITFEVMQAALSLVSHKSTGR